MSFSSSPPPRLPSPARPHSALSVSASCRPHTPQRPATAAVLRTSLQRNNSEKEVTKTAARPSSSGSVRFSARPFTAPTRSTNDFGVVSRATEGEGESGFRPASASAVSRVIPAPETMASLSGTRSPSPGPASPPACVQCVTTQYTPDQTPASEPHHQTPTPSHHTHHHNHNHCCHRHSSKDHLKPSREHLKPYEHEHHQQPHRHHTTDSTPTSSHTHTQDHNKNSISHHQLTSGEEVSANRTTGSPSRPHHRHHHPHHHHHHSHSSSRKRSTSYSDLRDLPSSSSSGSLGFLSSTGALESSWKNDMGTTTSFIHEDTSLVRDAFGKYRTDVSRQFEHQKSEVDTAAQKWIVANEAEWRMIELKKRQQLEYAEYLKRQMEEKRRRDRTESILYRAPAPVHSRFSPLVGNISTDYRDLAEEYRRGEERKAELRKQVQYLKDRTARQRMLEQTVEMEAVIKALDQMEMERQIADQNRRETAVLLQQDWKRQVDLHRDMNVVKGLQERAKCVPSGAVY